MSDIKNNSANIFSAVPNRGIIKVTGEDAAKFLQGVITNNIYSNHTIYAMILTPQGRYLFDLFITKVGEDYWCEVDKASMPALISKLKMYRLRSKVEIEDLGAKYAVYYSHHALDISKIAEYHDPRFAKMGIRTIVEHSNIIESSVDNGYIGLDPASKISCEIPDQFRDGKLMCSLYLEDKYKYAIPDGAIDLIQEKSMPQEYGADYLNCIDYQKGCYVGQEVISRTKYQGVVKKIYRVIGSGSLEGIEKGTPIVAGSEVVGSLCSGYKNRGIGLIRVEEYERFKSQEFEMGGVRIELGAVEW